MEMNPTGFKSTVLCVDDHSEFLTMLKDLVSAQGFAVIATINPHSALDTLKSGQPIDAVVSDINMPGLGGIELLRQARAAGNDIPFVFLTGNEERAVVVEALRLGACDFLEKPFKREALIDAVRRAALLGMATRDADTEVKRLLGLGKLPPEKAEELRQAHRQASLAKFKKLLDP